MAANDSISIARFLPPTAFFDQSEIDWITSLFKFVTLKKNEFFIHQGHPVTHVAFVVDGLLCRYRYHQKGHKIIDQYLFNGHFFTDRYGYFSHAPSFNNIKAVTPCRLYTISVEDIETLRKTSHKYKEIIDSIIIQALNRNQDVKEMCLIDDPLEKIGCSNDYFGHWLPEINKRDLTRYLKISHTKYYRVQHK